MTHQVDLQTKTVVKMVSIQLKVSAMLFTCALMEFNSKINSVQRVLFSMARSVIGQLLLTAPKPPPQLPLPPPLPPPKLPQLQQLLLRPKLKLKLSQLLLLLHIITEVQLPRKNPLPPPPTRSRFQIVILQSLTLVARSSKGLEKFKHF